MSAEEIQKRAREGQQKFREPYRKMMDRVEKCGRDKWLNAIITFFNVAEIETWDEKTLDSQNRIRNLSDKDMKSFCQELCREAINRDYVNWVASGVEGNVGRDVYKSMA